MLRLSITIDSGVCGIDSRGAGGPRGGGHRCISERRGVGRGRSIYRGPVIHDVAPLLRAGVHDALDSSLRARLFEVAETPLHQALDEQVHSLLDDRSELAAWMRVAHQVPGELELARELDAGRELYLVTLGGERIDA